VNAMNYNDELKWYCKVPFLLSFQTLGVNKLDNRLWIKQVHEICLDESVTHDFEFLSSGDRNHFNDTELDNAAELIKNADEKTQAAIMRLMRFSAQNSLSALIHLIDMQFTLEDNVDELNKTNLLDEFFKAIRK
jgi:hypothetical protein